MSATDCVFSVPGGLTLPAAVPVLNTGIEALERGATEFDFSQVSDIDSTALAVMFAWLRAAAARKVTLRFSHLPSNLASLADVYGVSELLTQAA